MRTSTFIIVYLTLATACQARTITVDDDGPANFNNIQAAIDDSNAGDIIEVQPGIYTGTGNRDIDFLGKAITVRSTDPNDPNIVAATVIDCNGTEDEPHRGFNFHNDEDADSVLEGLTIMNGWDSVGAGIYCNSASPTIRHCVISGNISRHHGGGLYCRFSSPVITNCTLRDNTATHGHGGGIFCLGGSPDISTCIISDNSAGSSGGGLFNNNSNPVLLDCDFSDNSAGDYGGGVCNTNDSIAIMTDCTFGDNRADYCGDDTYSEGESCIDLNKRVADARMYNIVSSGGPSGEYQMSGSSGTVYYVNGLCGNDSWAGTDPCCVEPNGPKQTIQGAINDAENDDTIIVYPHIYLENITIEANDISLTSIDPNDPNVVEATVIDGGGGGSVVTFAGTEGPNCLLTGFTITNGLALYLFNSNGGGIYGGYSVGTRATIKKCVINGNITSHTASGFGGGIYNCDGVIADCIISNNRVSWEGGGGGLANCDGPITNCIITGNYCQWSFGDGGGGLLRCNGNISGCIITNNSENGGYMNNGGRGGGLSRCSGLISNCLIANNRVYSSLTDLTPNLGGGLYLCNGTITNCTIVSNIVEDNEDIGMNRPHSGGGLADCSGNINNCIIWNNTAPLDSQLSSTSEPNYSCIQDWTGGGIGNISADPCFVDPNNPDPNLRDYHLLSGSPCINTGDPNHPIDPNETDIDGQPRVIGGRIDMGADEVVIATMRFTPAALNPFSQGKWVKAHLVLPAGFAAEDVDGNTAALLEPIGIESDYINVFVNKDGLVEIEVAFDRAAFCEARVNDEATEVRVTGSFTNGEYFYGTDTIRIINGGLRYVAVLATYWLEAGCGVPDWCGGADLNHSSTVDFVDFALFDGCCIEVVRD